MKCARAVVDVVAEDEADGIGIAKTVLRQLVARRFHLSQTMLRRVSKQFRLRRSKARPTAWPQKLWLDRTEPRAMNATDVDGVAGVNAADAKNPPTAEQRPLRCGRRSMMEISRVSVMYERP